MAELSVPRRVTPIIALDVADAASAHSLVSRRGVHGDLYQVGLELFTAVGPSIVE